MITNPYHNFKNVVPANHYNDYVKQTEFAKIANEFFENFPEEKKKYDQYTSELEKKIKEFSYSKENPTAYAAAKQTNDVVSKLDELIKLQSQVLAKLSNNQT